MTLCERIGELEIARRLMIEDGASPELIEYATNWIDALYRKLEWEGAAG